MANRKDIAGFDDIKWLVDRFYTKVREDALLGPVFKERIGDDWGPHLSVMYSFWNMIIFRAGEYSGNPFARHVTMPLEGPHFERWLDLFFATLQEQFEGPVTSSTLEKARTIATVFSTRINQQ